MRNSNWLESFQRSWHDGEIGLFSQLALELYASYTRQISSQCQFNGSQTACHQTDRLTDGDGTAITICRSLDHLAVPSFGLRPWKWLPCSVGNTSLKILVVYFPPAWSLIRCDQSDCLADRIPVLIVGDLSAKYMDWKCMLITAKSSLLHDYANVILCLLYRLDKTISFL